MNVVLESITIPETGQLKIQRTVDIHVSAATARRYCNRWLLENVTTRFIAKEPTLHVDEVTVWRVPIHFTYNRGSLGCVGTIAVDAVTGDLKVAEDLIEQFLQRGTVLTKTAPSYKPMLLSPSYFDSLSLPPPIVNQ